jgi:hypothetical protein
LLRLPQIAKHPISAGSIPDPSSYPQLSGYFFAWRKVMPITAQQLLQILPNAGKQAGVFVPGV